MPYYLVKYSYSSDGRGWAGHDTVWAEDPGKAEGAFWRETRYSQDIVTITSVEG